jgi:hypothetical protein
MTCVVSSVRRSTVGQSRSLIHFARKVQNGRCAESEDLRNLCSFILQALEVQNDPKLRFPPPFMNGMNGMNGIEPLPRLERAKSDSCAHTRTHPRLLLPPSLLPLPRTLHHVRLRRRGLRRQRWRHQRFRGRPRRRSRCIDPAGRRTRRRRDSAHASSEIEVRGMEFIECVVPEAEARRVRSEAAAAKNAESIVRGKNLNSP